MLDLTMLESTQRRLAKVEKLLDAMSSSPTLVDERDLILLETDNALLRRDLVICIEDLAKAVGADKNFEPSTALERVLLSISRSNDDLQLAKESLVYAKGLVKDREFHVRVKTDVKYSSVIEALGILKSEREDLLARKPDQEHPEDAKPESA